MACPSQSVESMWTRRLWLLPALALVTGCVAGAESDDLEPPESEAVAQPSNPAFDRPSNAPLDSCSGQEIYLIEGMYVAAPKFCTNFYMYQGDPPPEAPLAEEAELSAINPPPVEALRGAKAP
jgi:hypothetical protein